MEKEDYFLIREFREKESEAKRVFAEKRKNRLGLFSI